MKISKLMTRMLFIVGLVAASAPVASAIELKYDLKQTATMKDILQENVSKRIALRLNDGSEIEGTIEKVGDTLVHISRLPEYELFYMIVSIDRISAVRLMVKLR